MEQGWIAASGSVISLVLWLTIFMVPLGGYTADRVRGKGLLIRASTLLSAILMFSASRTPYALAILIAFGVIAGLPAGAMMSLSRLGAEPAEPAGRDRGILHAVLRHDGPRAGHRRPSCRLYGRAATAFDFNAILLVACPVLLAIFMNLRQGLVAKEIAI